MKATPIKRFAAAATIGVALVVSAPAAVVAGAETTAQDQPTSVFSAPGDGTRTAVEVREGPTITVAPDFQKWLDSQGASDCFEFQVCMWTRNSFGGNLYKFFGDYRPCEGWRFEGTELQDQVWSFWNNSSGPVSVWDRFRDGSFNYQKLAPAFPADAWDNHVFSDAIDAWVYDPRNDCRILTLHKVNI